MVVGSEAAHTPSRFSVRSSMPDATTSGGTHAKHAVSPGMITCKHVVQVNAADIIGSTLIDINYPAKHI